MKKTEFIMTLFGHLLEAKGNKITMQKVKDLFPKARSSYFRNVSEILNFMMPSGEPLLKKIKEEDQEFLVFNKAFTKEYIPEGEENIFNLQALTKLGQLLDNTQMNESLKDLKDIYQINGRAREINEKFFHLTKLSTISDKLVYKDIVNALLKNNVVNFKYNSKAYLGYHFLSICQYRDSLYVLAFKDSFSLSKVKTFKMNRFESVEILENTFSYPSKWNVEEYFKSSSGIITGQDCVAKIRVYRESRKHIQERSFFNKEQVESNDLFDEYDLVYTSVDEFLGQLFVYAQDVEILSPISLKEAFMEKAEQALLINSKLAS